MLTDQQKQIKAKIGCHTRLNTALHSICLGLGHIFFLSAVRQIYRDWSPAIAHHLSHKTWDKPLFKYTQIRVSGKDTTMVSPDTEEEREQSCQTGYLTGSCALT